MIAEIDQVFLTKYKHIYPSAHSLSYTFEQIDYLFNIVRNHNVHLISYPQIEIVIKTIIVKHQLPFNELIKQIKEGKFDLITLAGKYNYKVSDILITYIRNEK